MENIDTPDQLDSLKKVERLWFDDADVVFCAGKSKFRVSRGILSAQSTIFRDMFSLPRAEGDKVQTRNVPYTIIMLQDDPKDLYYFFLAIFDASFYSLPPAEYPLQVTLSILRLAHKYEVPFLVLRAVAHMDNFFPSTRRSLDENRYHDSLYNDDNNPGTVNIIQGNVPETDASKPDSKSQRIAEYLDILTIFDTELPWFIPAVLYILVTRYKIDDIMEHPHFDSLPSQYRLLIVQSEINHAMEDYSQNSWLGVLPARTCMNMTWCLFISRTIQGEDNQSSPRSRVSQSDGLVSVPIQGAPRKLCQNCQQAGEQHQKAHRENFWNQYWITCGFESRDQAMEVRSRTIADLEKGVTKFGDIEFEAQ